MTSNISYLSDYESYDGGYVSFGQGGGKITGKAKDVLFGCVAFMFGLFVLIGVLPVLWKTILGSASEGSAKKKGRTVVVTTEDMHKRRNDVKVRTTLLLALPDEHQLRFSKYKTAQELWAVILKTFGGNEATKKTKKNQLKQQYGNFKAEGIETQEQTFNRLQAI
nr:ribonuclease H-like domain-containing protein [Tanacetum cinerariifolium]